MANERRTAIHPAKSDRKWRRLARLRNGSLVCFLVCLIGAVSIFAFAGAPLYRGLEYAAIALSLCWGASIGFAFLFQALLTKHIWRTLQSKDVTGLGCWIDLVLGVGGIDSSSTRSHQCQMEARAALLAQLPLLTEETAPLLRPGDRNTLYKTLYGSDTELIAVVLPVVPILGDASALRGVQHLADGKGAAAMHPELQTAAQSSRTRLQARLALSSSSEGLLRASHPPQSPEKELLLPVQANNETDPKELLRADPRK